MVKDSDAEDLRDCRQPIGALAVFPRRHRVSGGMVVEKYDGRSAVKQSRLETFPRMNYRGGEASDADRMVADRPVLAIERDQYEKLAIKGGKLLSEALVEIEGLLESRIACKSIFCFLHQHDPVPGKQVLEFLHA